MSGEKARTAAAAGGEAVEALVAHVRRTGEERCRAILREASAEAERTLAEARRRARLRVGEAAAEARGEAERRQRSARAQAETRLRRAQHAAMRAAVEAAWGHLSEALPALWDDEKVRRHWVAAALAQAERRLPPGTWRLEHPPGWDPAEVAAALRATAERRAGVDVQPAAVEDLAAGVRLLCGGACLDASPAGLLARPARVQARLLARLEAESAALAEAVKPRGVGDDARG